MRSMDDQALSSLDKFISYSKAVQDLFFCKPSQHTLDQSQFICIDIQWNVPLLQAFTHIKINLRKSLLLVVIFFFPKIRTNNKNKPTNVGIKTNL